MSKNKIPDELSGKCHIIIHSATTAAASFGAIPIPIADAIPIGAVQISMVVALGKVFGLTIGKATAEAIIGASTAATVGRFTATQLSKPIPGLGSAVGAVTAAAITEALGWAVAYDFYRVSVGESPEKVVKAVGVGIDYFNKAGKVYKKGGG